MKPLRLANVGGVGSTLFIAVLLLLVCGKSDPVVNADPVADEDLFIPTERMEKDYLLFLGLTTLTLES